MATHASEFVADAAELPVSFADVAAAAERLSGVAHKTPVMTSRTVNERTRCEVFFKCENFQRTGSFKFRGAYNAIAQLTPEQRQRGVLTFSSGNHAQAIALSGQLLGVATTIIMPDDAPVVKQQATQGYGAEVRLYDRTSVNREALAQELATEQGSVIIPPYDHPHIIAGQGTAAKELLEDVGPLDYLLVCCGGGGLLSGSAIAAHHLAPNCRMVGVEPAAGDDATRSFYSRTLQTVHNPDTIADGARTPFLGKLTFPLVLHYVTDMVAVPDQALLRTLFFLWERMKLVLEPTGGLAATALLENFYAVPSGSRVGVILSGGNVDLRQVASLFAAMEL
ncbi:MULTISPECIES: threo-3-hydroxy-L-aspartate ammonia-lyase [unclassified Leptolyngbya]|uniref:threo-3-hydroxy-L-aspartate ammonia-lyase n=1 Tax=unclassified Leptolyngbya TaxID=2650499 RepID=UPI001683EF36|nr:MULTISPECIES: threo-3-hydroxy-L-aspartate ammonia-lyase [unclassified Leptolyngbya]MBD1912182.1 threo-3-hydroxy-L-aspartate ammonia-lyase [Leptolyngbya sp. FACHB-8]MBD2155073.1 threo-3-hydroxy-L-aspartate ammonia-lyase [Leptolyngbya sp. FACHB-16]